MYTPCESMEALCREMDADKTYDGAESAMLNRYPVRFVLLDSFEDLRDFLNECHKRRVHIESIEKWLHGPDLLLTYTQLEEEFRKYVKSEPARDYVLIPFFEMVRFDSNAYSALMRTVRLTEARAEAQANKQRIYIPIIGMQKDTSSFLSDNQVHAWGLHSERSKDKYRIIFTRGTLFDVKNLDEAYEICPNVSQWLRIWTSTANVQRSIICSSKVMYENVRLAQPDSAFDYVVCSNAYDFLKTGLRLDIGNIEAQEADMKHWEKLASLIDSNSFCFERFAEERIPHLRSEDVSWIIRAWHEYRDDFSRWLISTYFLSKDKGQTYLGTVLCHCKTHQESELCTLLATMIFEMSASDEMLEQRRAIMREILRLGMSIPTSAEATISTFLIKQAGESGANAKDALKYITGCTTSEKSLVIQWIGSGLISREIILDIYPDLYYYSDAIPVKLEDSVCWVNDYIAEYQRSKIANTPSKYLKNILHDKNATAATFASWREEFKTVKTLLHNRSDIDIYYWIDGLGIDWIPYIKHLIDLRKPEGIFLNEVYIASAELPTKTENNKVKLQQLSSTPLLKIGDIDTYAHTPKQYPEYIIEEFAKINEAIRNIIELHGDKTIAIVSDHGVSYMAQHGKGLKLSGVKADHSGRCASVSKKLPKDNAYVFSEDGKTICALTHNSLSNKSQKGKGAHGGATPEEVLVPVFIISNKKTTCEISAILLNKVLSADKPIIRYKINGDLKNSIPQVRYGNTVYPLHQTSTNCYESDRVILNTSHSTMVLEIGDFSQHNSVEVRTGIEENDLFDF